MLYANKPHNPLRYACLVGLLLLFMAAASGCSKEMLRIPQVDAKLAETVIVTRNGWDRDILPSASLEAREFIDKEIAACEPTKSYQSWEEVFPDGNWYGSPNTITLVFPDDAQISIQCLMTDKSVISITDRSGRESLYQVAEDWISNFIEITTEMVERTPDESYAAGSEPVYEFTVMTVDNAPIGCEFGSDKGRQIDSLEMLAELESLKGFSFPSDSGTVLRFHFSSNPKDVYVRCISEGNWQEAYPYSNQRITAPDDPGIYNLFVDISWDDKNSETVFFSITIGDRELTSAPAEQSKPVVVAADEPVAPDPPPLVPGSSFIKRWEDRTVSEKYYEAAVNGTSYYVSSGKIDPSFVGAPLGDSTACGYDEYDNDQKKTIKCNLYSLNAISPKCAVAVKYEGSKGYFPFTNHEYFPATLGDFVNDMDLWENLVFGKIYYGFWKDDIKASGNYVSMEYTLPDPSAIWSLLLSDDSLLNSGDAHYGASLMSVSIDVKAIGVKNIALSVNEDGYLQTNILATGKTFYIGKEKVQAFVDYVLTNGKGIVMEAGDGEEIPE